MTENSEKVEAAGPDADIILTPGAVLQKAREVKGLDVRKAADQLRMSRVKLIALEADAFEEFQGETFIRGYIKAYCRILDLDEAQAIARYENYVAAKAEAGQLVAPRETRSLGLAMYSQSNTKPIVIGIVVSLFVVALVIFFTNFSDDLELTAVSAPVESSVMNEQTIVLSGEQDEKVADRDELINISAINPSVDSPGVNEVPALSLPTNVVPLFDTLTIVFSEECWLEVSDAKGDVLATELKESGSEVVLQGKAPFNVMLGNARAAVVFLNGNKVDSNPRDTNRALRFTVD